MRKFSTHGAGTFRPEQLRRLGENVVFEEGVLVFHPETVSIGSNVYVGHRTMLKGHPGGSMTIGDDTWIGQACFFHSAGGLTIGSRVGIGPHVKILTSHHRDEGRDGPPLLDSPVAFAPVVVGDECNIGIGAIILPGATIGRGTQVGAGAVVAGDLPDFCVAAGVPAKVIRRRRGLAGKKNGARRRRRGRARRGI
jgi:acetyltransferase-like isoleucine patch superfamily enzyme